MGYGGDAVTEGRQLGGGLKDNGRFSS